VQTNIVIMNIEGTRKTPAEILGHLKGRGVLLSQGGYGSLRAVTHLDVSAEQVKQAAEEFRSVVALTAG
jgi:threonine aldolase